MRSVSTMIVIALVSGAFAGCCFDPLAGLAPAPSVEHAHEPLEPAPSVPPVDPVLVEPAPAPPGGMAGEASGRLSERAWAALAAGWVPQAPGASELAGRAQPIEGPIERGMLACRARVHGGGHDDSFLAGGADVSLAARWGDGAIRRTPQSPARVYTFPIAHLAAGDAIWVRVIDDDVLFDDTIAEGSTSFARAPFTMTMGQADVSCGAVPSAVVAARAAQATAAMSRAIDRLDGSEPDVTAHELGYPTGRAQAVLDAGSRAAAWVEWSDPELVAQIDRARAFEDAWDERAERAVERAADELPPPGAPVELGDGRRATVGPLECGHAVHALLEGSAGADDASASRPSCALRVTVEAGHAPLRSPALLPTSPAPLEMWLITSRGRTAAVSIVGRRDAAGWIPDAEERTVEPGQTIELVLGTTYGLDPVLLRLRAAPSRAVVARVR